MFFEDDNNMQDADHQCELDIERALSKLTHELEGHQLLDMLARVAQANGIDEDRFLRWTRIRHRDGTIATEIVYMNVLRSLHGRFRCGEKIVIGDRTWAARMM